MNKEKIIRKAEETARKLRYAERDSGNPLYKEANKAIMALLGVVTLPERKPERYNGCDPGKRGPHGGPCPICGAPAMAQNWDPESDTTTCKACGYTF